MNPSAAKSGSENPAVQGETVQNGSTQVSTAQKPAAQVAGEPNGKHPAAAPPEIELLPNRSVIEKALGLMKDPNVSITELAAAVSHDPVVTLELIRAANVMFFAQDRPAIFSAHNALVRLGSESINSTLQRMAERPPFADPAVAIEFERLRVLSNWISDVAGFVASACHNDLLEESESAALFSNFGHMIACAKFGATYVKLSKSLSRPSLNWRLLNEYNFDTKSHQISFLRLCGLPNSIFYAFDREMQVKNPNQAALRFIVESALELVEAFDSERWGRYSPKGELPSKSSLRMLKLTDRQYEQIYESCHTYREALLASIAGADDPTIPLQPEVDPNAAAKANLKVARVEPTYLVSEAGEEDALPEQLSPDAQKVLQLLARMCTEAKNSQDLLQKLLALLVTDAPFKRAALIVLGPDHRSAILHTSTGDGFDENQRIALNDPLSPLAMCLTKIRSFNSQGPTDMASPFGISAYALSPIKVKNPTPVVLYADSGLTQPVALEARKLFRLVVGLLNTTLPRLGGGLPKRPNIPANS